MQIANHDGRAVIVERERGIDIHEASGGVFGPGIESLYERWPEFLAWAQSDARPFAIRAIDIDLQKLRAPSPRPGQVFAIALNYHDHVTEGGFDIPTMPGVFTKFQSAITGPAGEITLPDGNVDWEIELVVVIGAEAHRINADESWSYVAGVTVGQDISERITQHRPPAPQFSLGKSFPGFAPMGPWLSTLDEFTDVDDIALRATVNGEVMQDSRTSQMIFDVPTIIEYLSRHVTLFPGDVIFTGTPSGVGKGRKPPVYLRPGDILESTIPEVGSMRHTMVS
jgi:2-keto-4-pentenoate hydratase/2-oxohepta-3-ene-1,7-dioic acid hydratase in catechol pathway